MGKQNKRLAAAERDDLAQHLLALSLAPSMEAAMYASGVLAGRLIELERLGRLSKGERLAWLSDAALAVSARRRGFENMSNGSFLSGGGQPVKHIREART